MATLCTDLTMSVSEFDRTQVVPVTCTTRTTPGYTSFTGITINHAHYNDIGAACRCADVQLVRIGYQPYTICKAHGFIEAGTLVRAVGKNGRPA